MTTLHASLRWLPIKTAPLAVREIWGRNSAGKLVVEAVPVLIEGLSVDARLVPVAYWAAGDYEDRWLDKNGNAVELTHWRPVRK